MNTNNLVKALVSVVLVLVVVWLGVSYPKGNTVVERIMQAGALSGPDIDSTYLSWNGLVTHNRSSAFQQATTTLCALRSPTNATSTLVLGSIQFNTGTSTTILVEIAKNSNLTSTSTTLLNSVLFPTGRGTILASTSVPYVLADPITVFSPGQYLVFKYGGVVGTNTVLAGNCKAQFVEN